MDYILHSIIAIKTLQLFAKNICRDSHVNRPINGATTILLDKRSKNMIVDKQNTRYRQNSK